MEINITLGDRDAVMAAVREALNLVIAFSSEETYRQELARVTKRLVEDAEESPERGGASVGYALYGFSIVAMSLAGVLRKEIEETQGTELDRLELMRAIESTVEGFFDELESN